MILYAILSFLWLHANGRLNRVKFCFVWSVDCWGPAVACPSPATSTPADCARWTSVSKRGRHRHEGAAVAAERNWRQRHARLSDDSSTHSSRTMLDAATWSESHKPSGSEDRQTGNPKLNIFQRVDWSNVSPIGEPRANDATSCWSSTDCSVVLKQCCLIRSFAANVYIDSLCVVDGISSAKSICFTLHVMFKIFEFIHMKI